MVAMPLHNLERAACQRQMRLGDLQKQRAQSTPLPTLGLDGVAVGVQRDAIDAFEPAEVETRPVYPGTLDLRERRHRGRLGRANEDLVLPPDIKLRRWRQRAGQRDARLERCRGVHLHR